MTATKSSLNESFDHLAVVALKVKAERDALLKGCIAAHHALRSYQYGNSATGLAEEIADHLEKLIEKVKTE